MAGKPESETIVLHASLKKNLVFAFTVGFLIAFMIDQVDQVAVAWLVGTVGTSFLIFWLLQAARGLPKLVAHDDRLEIRSMSQARSVPWTECSDIWVWRPLVFPLIAIEYTDSFRATLGRTVSREGVDEAVLAVFKPSADEVCDLLRAKLSRTTAQSNDAAPTNDPDRLVPHGHSNAYRRVVRWISDNKSIMPVLSICTAIVLATVLALAYLLGGTENCLTPPWRLFSL